LKPLLWTPKLNEAMLERIEDKKIYLINLDSSVNNQACNHIHTFLRIFIFDPLLVTIEWQTSQQIG